MVVHCVIHIHSTHWVCFYQIQTYICDRLLVLPPNLKTFSFEKKINQLSVDELVYVMVIARGFYHLSLGCKI